tara:strand:- start:272 stop:490 length:219 start_codon:yes stop_codon:yes gene_type:complete
MNKEELKEEIIKTLREFKSDCFNQSKDLSLKSEEDVLNQFKKFNMVSVFSKMSDIFGLLDELDITEGKKLDR